MKRLFAVLLVALTMAALLAPIASAAQPYQTYTYNIDGKPVYSPDAYSPEKEIDGEYMGMLDYYPVVEITDEMQLNMTKPQVEALTKLNTENEELRELADIRDVFVDDYQNVYLVEAKHNRVIVLDRYYKIKFIISDFVNDNGVPDKFNNPSGVFVSQDYIYVCDTDANRIAMFYLDGTFYKMIYAPESDLFSENSIYKPVAVAVDQYNRIFVVSSTTYEGIIVMDEDSNFSGFIGAQKVTISPLEILWRKFQTKAQRAQAEDLISTEFNNIAIDSKGFIYVTTSSIDESSQAAEITSKAGDYAPVKKLNAQGNDVMARNGFFSPSGEVYFTEEINGASTSTSGTAKVYGVSKIIDVAVGPSGTWSIIDEKRNRVFTYDQYGNLLFAFGDTGMQMGNLQSIEAIAYQGEKMLLLDKTANTFTVYRRTEYGDILVSAIANDKERDYTAAAEKWQEVIKRNINFDAAYIGIGKSLARKGEYTEAMVYFQAAHDIDDYSSAYSEVRKAWVSKYVLVVPIVIIVVCVLVSKFFSYAGKVNKRTQLKVGKKSFGEELLYAFHLIFHPFDGFWDLKHELRGSVRAGTVYLLLTILVFFYQSIGTSYIKTKGAEGGSFVVQAISVIIPLALWVVANWCLTTLFDGEGSLKDVYIATTYSLVPLILTIIPATLISNVLVAAEMDFVNLISGIGFVWAGLLIFFGMMVTHDYSMFKSIVTSIGTIVGMAFIMFVGVLFSTLLMKMVTFISNIIVEISYRV